MRRGFQGEAPGFGGLPARAPSGHWQARGTRGPGHGRLQQPLLGHSSLRVPIGHWPAVPLESRSADGPRASGSSQQTLVAFALAPHASGDVGVLPGGAATVAPSLFVEFPDSRHLLRDCVRSPLGPLAPCGSLGLPLCQIP